MSSQLCAPVLVIRPSCSSDAGPLLPLMRQLRYPTTQTVLKEHISTFQKNPNHVCGIVAELDGVVVGTIFLKQYQTHDMARPVTQITALIVDESNRGTGIGRRLLLEAEQWSKERQSSHLVVTSMKENNLSARTFYEHLGFTYSGYRLIKSLV